MFFIEPDRTPYDLSFRVGDIPVRVHPMFWLITALLGGNTLRHGLSYLILWVGCVFVSILIHELGHVIMGRIFGAYGHIVLYSFGGLAIGSNNLRGRWQRVAVLFAGPLAGFLFFFGLLAVMLVIARREMPPMVEEAFDNLVWINVAWGILNLFPIFPLDGGQISRELLQWLSPGNGLRISLGLSAFTAGLLAILFLYLQSVYSALFFAMLAFSSFQAMQQLPPPGYQRPLEEDRMSWERDADYWKR